MKLGEIGEVAFLAENRDEPRHDRHRRLQRHAGEAGAYFNKIECFCFTEQTLAAGETRRDAGDFFVDPAIADDPDLDGTDTITLSYTFYPAPTAPARRSPPQRARTAADAVVTLGARRQWPRLTPTRSTHPYHLVDPSPWPAIGAVSAFALALGAIAFMHGASLWLDRCPALLGILYTMFVLVARRHQGSRTRAITRRSSSSASATA